MINDKRDSESESVDRTHKWHIARGYGAFGPLNLDLWSSGPATFSWIEKVSPTVSSKRDWTVS